MVKKDEWIGKKLGDCKIIRQIGRGGMSTIYLAHQETVGRDVVVKVLSESLSSDGTFLKRFNMEVETTATLQHPHIVPIYTFGHEDESPYIIMAYIPGGSLEDLRVEGGMSLADLVPIITQVAQALDYAHERGVIHRDIKPANILLDSQQNAILGDFGIARVLAATQNLTRDSLIGTVAYLPPEVLDRRTPLTSAADVYSLAVTVYEMLTGEKPFTGDTSAQIIWAHVNDPAPLLSETNHDIPVTIDRVLQKALAKNPAARYQKASEFATALMAVAMGDPIETIEDALAATMVNAPPQGASRMENTVGRTIDQIVKVLLASGGNGSGFYLPGDQIITCDHVVSGSPGIYIEFHTGERIEADVIATDPTKDLALLQLQDTPETLSLDDLSGIIRDIDVLEPGEKLVAIGHPLGLDWSVTGGHYNAIRQPGEEPLPKFGIKLKVPLVQVDVTINAGNSGGPILDVNGGLVGLATSIINPAVANNIGFAIYAPEVWAFWETHRETTKFLEAYTCWHHHPEGSEHCAYTGKPIKEIPHSPMPTSVAVRYSCGHSHPPELRYCPATGKPVEQLEAPANGEPIPLEDATTSVICSNCGTSFAPKDKYCPTCGKPI